MYYCRFPLLFQGLGHVEFMVGVVALWQVSVKCFCFPLSSFHQFSKFIIIWIW